MEIYQPEQVGRATPSAAMPERVVQAGRRLRGCRLPAEASGRGDNELAPALCLRR